MGGGIGAAGGRFSKYRLPDPQGEFDREMGKAAKPATIHEWCEAPIKIRCDWKGR